MKAVLSRLDEAILPLIEHGIHPNFENSEGEYAWSIAYKLKNVSSVRLSEIYEIEEEEGGVSGTSHWVCKSVCPEIVEVILDK